MKKNIIAKVLMVVLLMLGIASSVWANGVASKKAVLEGDNYVFFIQNINTGYNSAKANKKFVKEAASCRVLNTPIPTNFLIIAADGVQITENKIINNIATTSSLLHYYAKEHEGWVRLRANSGSTVSGYEVRGDWNPNGFIIRYD